MSKVVFPSFAGEIFEPFEMRQLVSALELRFQSIEADGQSLFDTETGNELDNRYSLVGHLHSESEITDLAPYLLNITGESIFDLSDVEGAPSPNDVLQWDGTAFVPTSASATTFELDDLTDVSVPAPVDGQILTYVTANLRWEALVGTAVGITSFELLTDTNIGGQSRYDLVFNADGVNWEDTAGLLQWNPSSEYLQLANGFSINWLDTSFATQELLAFESVGAPGTAFADIWGQESINDNEVISSLTYVDVNAATRFVDVSTLTDAAEYFFYMTGRFSNTSSFPTGNMLAFSEDGGTTIVTRSEGQNDLSGNAGYPWQFGYQTTIDTAGTDLTQVAKETGGGTVNVYDWNIFGLNVTDLITAGDYYYDTTEASTVSGINPAYTLTLAAVTVAAGDYLIFVNGHFDGATASNMHYVGLYDGTTTYEIHNQEGAAASNQHAGGGVYILEGLAASTTLT